MLSQSLSGSYVSSIFEIWPFATKVRKLITLQYKLSKKHSTLFSRNISSGSRLLRATTSSCSGDIHVTFFNGLLAFIWWRKGKIKRFLLFLVFLPFRKKEHNPVNLQWNQICAIMTKKIRIEYFYFTAFLDKLQNSNASWMEIMPSPNWIHRTCMSSKFERPGFEKSELLKLLHSHLEKVGT